METRSGMHGVHPGEPTLAPPPETGDPAPAVTFLDGDGDVVALRDLHEAAHVQHGLALVFFRHFGCPFCKEHAHELDRQRDAFRSAGVDIVMIGTGTPEQARTFRQDFGLRNRVLTDPGGAAYRAFGLIEAPMRSLLDPRVLAGGARAAIKGYLPQRPQGRPLQLQGQFLIDRAGTIRSVSRPRVMSEIPSAAALLVDARTLTLEQG